MDPMGMCELSWKIDFSLLFPRKTLMGLIQTVGKKMAQFGSCWSFVPGIFLGGGEFQDIQNIFLI